MSRNILRVITQLHHSIDYYSKERPSVSLSSRLLSDKTAVNYDEVLEALELLIKYNYVKKQGDFFVITKKGIITLKENFSDAKLRDCTFSRLSWYPNKLPQTTKIIVNDDDVLVYNIDFKNIRIMEERLK